MKTHILSITFFIIISSLLFHQQVHAQQVDSTRVDSLLNILKTTDKDETKVDAYIKIAKLYGYEAYNYENGETALNYLKKGNDFARTSNYQKGLCDILLVEVGVLQRRGEADVTYQKALEALEIAENIEELTFQHRAYNYLGILSSMLNEREQAIENFEKAVAIAEKDKNAKLKGVYLSNLGFFYKKNNELDKALVYQLEAVEILKAAKAHPEDQIFNLVTIAETYQKKADYRKAIDYFLECLALSDYEDRLQNDLRIYNGLSRCYQELREYGKAIDYAQKSVQNGDKLKDPYWQSISYQVLSEVYEKTNRPAEALAALKKHKEFSDKVYNERQLNKVQELETKHKTEQQEQQLHIQEIKLSQKTTQRNIFIMVAVLLLGLGWYFWQLSQRLTRSKKTIEGQTEELQQLYESKNRFFANIAHELRTPLTLIASPISNIIHKHELPSATHQSLGIVQRNINYLKLLVNQILDLSKQEVEELPVRLATFSLSDLLKVLVADFTSYATYQKINFETPKHLENDITLTTDGEKLYIILKNLLSNAFKYTNSGGQVALNYMDMGNALQVSVRDSGRGISKTDIQHIFKPYFQTSNQNTPIEGGTGIGLAICKEYIERVGGIIQVSSEQGKGSTFMIQFPKKLNGTVNHTDLSFLQPSFTNDLRLSSENKNDGQTLLIVEDNPDICFHLQSILQDDYQLIFANNGAEGLKQLESQAPDLILTDLMMPVMDGFEFIEKVKGQDQWRHIPVITLTARSEMTDKLHALRIGVDDYLIKPFHEEELQIRIAKLLEYQENRQHFIEEEIERQEASNHTDDTPTMTETPIISQEDETWLKSLESITTENLGNINFNVHQLGLELAMSTSQLYRKTKLLTGLTPRKYVDQIRYHQARKLLEVKAYSSVKRVAYEVGFKDEKNFARNFKKRFGRYPSVYLE